MISILLAATLFFAGDSTLDDNRFKHPYRSWGTEVGFYMKSGNVVRDFARSGASTKSFLDSGVWSKLIAEVKPGDFVVIEFGHNDQKRSNKLYLEKRWADPNGLFREIVNAHTVLGVGSEISGGVRNVLMKDCTAGDVYRVFYLKTNRRRGGFLDPSLPPKRIRWRNVVAEKVTDERVRVSNVVAADVDPHAADAGGR